MCAQFKNERELKIMVKLMNRHCKSRLVTPWVTVLHVARKLGSLKVATLSDADTVEGPCAVIAAILLSKPIDAQLVVSQILGECSDAEPRAYARAPFFCAAFLHRSLLLETSLLSREQVWAYKLLKA